MWVASFITATVAIVSVFLLLYAISRRGMFRLLLAAFFCTLPMCWIMYHLIRMPLDHWLAAMFTRGNVLFWIRTVYAPVTEEPAKLWPLLLPFVRGSLTRRNVAAYAIALGGGFAVGEIFTVADLIHAKMPDIANLPWYSLFGFINERLMTVAIHSGMTVSALVTMQRSRSLIAGLVVSMTLHFFANLPISLAKIGWLGAEPAISQSLVVIWITFCFIASVALLFWFSEADRKLGTKMYGRAVCPSCGSHYARRALQGASFGFSLRFEPCPACGKWHWTRRIDDSDATT